MPRSTATAVENSFVKGLVTEASGLNFPENACTETWNCIFEQTGKVRRRLGVAPEEDFEFVSVTNHEHAITNYLWQAVATAGVFTFLVQQTGPLIRFYKLDGLAAVSASEQAFTIDLDDHLSGGAAVTTVRAQFASGHGKLFITHPQCEPLAVIYDELLDDITVTEIVVEVRDYEGVEDGLDVDERPATLSDLHKYNLFNQGWYEQTNSYQPSGGFATRWPHEVWFNYESKYPSNAQTWWTYKRPQAGGSEYIEHFDPSSTAKNIIHPNTPAPRGHYIYNAFNIDRSTTSGVPNIPVETSGFARPSAVAFYAGRVFYAGVKSRKFSSKIYYSQIVERDSQLGTCYQSQDPTSEETPDLLPTDGGVINIPEIAEVLKLVAKGSVLFVFATNGVWQISGSEGLGFRANDYSVTKITETPTLSADTFVLVDGNPVWLNRSGIWTLVPNQAGSAFDVKSLTDQSIKTFFQSIPDSRKGQMQGVFNPRTRVIQWVYADNEDLPENSFNKILNLNTLTGAFYPWSFTTTDVQLKAITVIEGDATVATQNEYTIDGDDVQIVGEAVVQTDIDRVPTSSYFLYTVYSPGDGLTFAEEYDTTYVDWAGIASATFESYAVAGYKVYGEGDKAFQNDYISVNYEPVVDGGLYIQSQWEYANHKNTGRWSSKQQVYRSFDTNYDYAVRKLKLRGHGRALQIRFMSHGQKPFIISGWTVFITGNQVV